MDPNVLILLLIALCLLVIGGIVKIFVFGGNQSPQPSDGGSTEREPEVNPVGIGGDRQPARARAGLGRMARVTRAAQEAEAEEELEEELLEQRRRAVGIDSGERGGEGLEGRRGEERDDGGDDGGDDDDDDDLAGEDGEEQQGGEGSSGRMVQVKRLGKKKAEKLERKEEKRKLREYQEAMREEKKKQESEFDEERKRRREEEREQEAEAERLEAQRLAEIAKAEEEEYLRLKKQFTVEESGVAELSPEELADLLDRMVSYVRRRKVVTAEELASEFQVKTHQAVARLKQLDQEGRIQGVLDDRGKYVYITTEEFEAVAMFIRRKGRVSKEELAAASNRLVDLNPAEEAREDLKEPV